MNLDKAEWFTKLKSEPPFWESYPYDYGAAGEIGGATNLILANSMELTLSTYKLHLGLWVQLLQTASCWFQFIPVPQLCCPCFHLFGWSMSCIRFFTTSFCHLASQLPRHACGTWLKPQISCGQKGSWKRKATLFSSAIPQRYGNGGHLRPKKIHHGIHHGQEK